MYRRYKPHLLEQQKGTNNLVWKCAVWLDTCFVSFAYTSCLNCHGLVVTAKRHKQNGQGLASLFCCSVSRGNSDWTRRRSAQNSSTLINREWKHPVSASLLFKRIRHRLLFSKPMKSRHSWRMTPLTGNKSQSSFNSKNFSGFILSRKSH